MKFNCYSKLCSQLFRFFVVECDVENIQIYLFLKNNKFQYHFNFVFFNRLFLYPQLKPCLNVSILYNDVVIKHMLPATFWRWLKPKSLCEHSLLEWALCAKSEHLVLRAEHQVLMSYMLVGRQAPWTNFATNTFDEITQFHQEGM